MSYLLASLLTFIGMIIGAGLVFFVIYVFGWPKIEKRKPKAPGMTFSQWREYLKVAGQIEADKLLKVKGTVYPVSSLIISERLLKFYPDADIRYFRQ